VVAPQLLAFTVGYALLVIVAVRGRSAVAAIASLIGVYAGYALIDHGGGVLISSLTALGEWPNLRVFIYIFLSLLVAGMLRETGYLDLLVRGASSAGCRFSYTAVPALIGLLPMPGGALVSAMAMKKKYIQESRMKPEWAVYLNFWFRHVWVPAWPLFQSIIITSAVLSTDPSNIVSMTWPASVITIAAGLAVAYPALARYTCAKESGGIGLLARAVWPFAVLAVLVFLGGIPLLAALAVTLVLVTLALRPGPEEIKGALRLATSPKIHAVLFEALILKELLERTGAPQALYDQAVSSGLPSWAVLYITPFILGLAAGGENFFAATAMPLLKGYLVTSTGIDPTALLIAYMGGFMGVMASPVHLCFALTVDYFKAHTGKSMALNIAATILATIIVLALTIGHTTVLASP